MNFKQFLNEAVEIDENDIISLIKRDCQPFLNEVKDRLMFRGLKKLSGNPNFVKLSVRKNRIPRHSSMDFHVYFNEAFEELHNVKNIRSRSIFGVGDQSTASTYGMTYAIFPIGDYTYWWSSSIGDSWIDFNDMYGEVTEESLYKFVDYGDYRDKGLNKALKTSHEIFVLCDDYYAIKMTSNIDPYQLID